jgi:3-polyprenyl-4-hydroxybenzoate decarboxylase
MARRSADDDASIDRREVEEEVVEEETEEDADARDGPSDRRRISSSSSVPPTSRSRFPASHVIVTPPTPRTLAVRRRRARGATLARVAASVAREHVVLVIAAVPRAAKSARLARRGRISQLFEPRSDAASDTRSEFLSA